MKTELAEIYWPLRIAYGVVPLLAGLDKYVGILADWERYVSPTAASLLPITPGAFLQLVGVVEIAVGLAILAGFTRIGALAAMGWLVLIAVDLAAGRLPDIAVPDPVMAVGAYSLARLGAARGEAFVPGLAVAWS